MQHVSLDNGNVLLYRADCFDVFSLIGAQTINMIFADLPYGTTQNKWDSVLSLPDLWKHVKRIRKVNAACVLTAQTPFDKILGVSNLKELKYEWIWEKDKSTGYLNANIAPMKAHENILVFYTKLPTYNPIKTQGKPYSNKHKPDDSGDNYGAVKFSSRTNITTRYPRSVLCFNVLRRVNHPTQKPVALMEYLIKTYTNEGDLVLDPVMGSGTTVEACINLNRRVIGIEKDIDKGGNSLGYFNYCVERAQKALDKRNNNEV